MNQSNLIKTKVPIIGMHCASCAYTVQKTLSKEDGVIFCEVNFGNEKANIEFDPEKTSIEELSKKIEKFGYKLATETIPSGAQEKLKNQKTKKGQQVMLETVHSHTMPDGSVMSDSEMHDHEHMNHKGIDHSEHLGINQTKEEKLIELNRQKKKVYFVMPVAILTFFLMLWEIAANNIKNFPMFPIPMEAFQSISLVVASIVLFWIGGEFLKEVVTFIKYRVANMYTLVGIGTLTSYLYSAILVLFPKVKESLELPDMLYFDVTIIVIGFIYLGKYLENKSKLKTGEAIEKLLGLQAKTALLDVSMLKSSNVKRLRDLGYDVSLSEIEVRIEDVEVDDVVIIKPGSKIPVDGIIISGKSFVDESMITGESMPIEKTIDDIVIGGTINKNGTFSFRATKVGSETMLSQIVEMVEEAQGSKAPIQGLADKISEVFVPAVLVISLLTLVGWIFMGVFFIPMSEALSIGILCFTGVLVIACPCALGLATPTAIIVGTGKAAENGILIKDAASLEKLHKVNIVVTDKTGTITKGKPEVAEIRIRTSEIRSQNDLIRLLASLEKNSEHPIAEAILNNAKSSNLELLEVANFEVIEGKGLSGQINGEKFYAGNLKLVKDLELKFDQAEILEMTNKGITPVIFTNSKEVLGIVGVADVLKENAKETVSALHKLGIKVVMLTGDNQNVADYIAKEVGIDFVVAEVLPQQKAEVIKQLKLTDDRQWMMDKLSINPIPNFQTLNAERITHNVVAMLGDGVNDAVALAAADVGIAMSTGTDVAIESASITLLRGDFSKVLQAIKLSKFTMNAIKQNLFWAFAYNIVGIPIAAGLLYPFGILLSPIIAGGAMALSSVSVVGNSLRLKGRRL